VAEDGFDFCVGAGACGCGCDLAFSVSDDLKNQVKKQRGNEVTKSEEETYFLSSSPTYSENQGLR
jgi:ferredoxin